MYTGAPFRSAETTAPVEAASVIHTPAPTIVMAGMVPNWPFGAVDPWVAAAVSIGAVGVTLVVIAIIWAVTNAVSSRRRERK